MSGAYNVEQRQADHDNLPPWGTKAFVRDLRMSLFLERVKNVTRDMEEGKVSRKAAAAQLRRAIRDVEAQSCSG